MRSEPKFLFLQGPHGPFFGQLAARLQAAGCAVLRIGFNKGDEYYWPDRLPYVRYSGKIASWPEALAGHLAAHAITDVVIYGDGRPVHAAARRLALQLELRIHCFEEGYLRPFWVTYERGGTNGNSALMGMSAGQICDAVAGRLPELRSAPAHWGSIWHHSWHGMIYHGQILFRNAAYPNYLPHRESGIGAEWWRHSKRLAIVPLSLLHRQWTTTQLLRSGHVFHLALLQLGHDSSVADHSRFSSMREFVETCIAAFARGGGASELLVFKAHPLEDGRERLRQAARLYSRQYSVADRVLFIEGGHLAPLLDAAKSVVTINSTAGQQALWRGLPLKALGRAVYGKPQFVSQQPLEDFYRNPAGPDAAAYRDFRSYLLNTSQVAGNFYMAGGRASILRRVLPMMLAELDPYAEFARRSSADTKQLRLVSSRGEP